MSQKEKLPIIALRPEKDDAAVMKALQEEAKAQRRSLVQQVFAILHERYAGAK